MQRWSHPSNLSVKSSFHLVLFRRSNRCNVGFGHSIHLTRFHLSAILPGRFAMTRQIRWAFSALAGAAVLTSASATSAQWFSLPGCGCATQPVARPVAQTCYQQVPITQYQQVKHKVRRPVTEVEYVEQPVTTYRPVVETKTVDVPMTTYQNVTEYQTRTTQTGNWQTNYHYRQKLTPCQYDPSPSPLGWLNRSAYRIRSAFTPNIVATRQFVPRTCAAQVPVTRRVAVQSVRQQTYKVTKYVPEQTTRRVAVNKVRWVEEEVIAMKPITVMQTVPVTKTAYGFGGYAALNRTALGWNTISTPATTISLAPTPDPVSAAKPATTRAASRQADDINRAHDDRDEVNSIERNQEPVRRSAVENPGRTLGQRSMFKPVRPRSTRAAGIARVGGWKASTPTAEVSPSLPPVSMPIAAAH
mgnify:CR=1 FL=1|jgi:hypothetical protein